MNEDIKIWSSLGETGRGYHISWGIERPENYVFCLSSSLDENAKKEQRGVTFPPIVCLMMTEIAVYFVSGKGNKPNLW